MDVKVNLSREVALVIELVDGKRNNEISRIGVCQCPYIKHNLFSF